MIKELKPEMRRKLAHFNSEEGRYEIRLDQWSPISWRDGRCGRFVAGDIVDKLAEYEKIDCDPIALEERIKDLEAQIKRLEKKDEIKKCPFCGSDVSIYVEWGSYEVSCDNEDCFLFGGVDLYEEDFTKAVDKWNKRV